MKLKCYAGEHVLSNKHFKVIRAFCDAYNYELDIKFDERTLMLETKGTVNPKTGFIVYFNGTRCSNIFELISIIEKTGGVPC